jgi:hypothetical protein
LKAKLKSGSSFTWQGIMAGLENFKRGCIWRVGDGSQINIWEDAWIPTRPSKRMMTPQGTILVTMVNDLINPMAGSWDEELIRSLLWSVDANRILEIPMAPLGMEDFVAWQHTKNGLFTVKSAYHAEWDYQFGRKEKRTLKVERSEISPVWKKLWKLNVPAKIKIFGYGGLCMVVFLV